MIPLAALPVFAVLVAAPPGPEDGCPSARQVAEAMQVRFPAFLIAPDQPAALSRGDVLRSVLDIAPDGTVLRFALVDARGDTQLRRTLPAPAHGKSTTECLALADTLAAIVERYLATIVYDIPESGPQPPPPPNRPAAPDAGPAAQAPTPAGKRAAGVDLGVAWRATAGGRGQQGGVEARLGMQLDLTRTLPRVVGVLNAGISPAVTAALTDTPRTASLQRFPFRLGALLALPAGPGWVEPVLQVGADLFVLSSTAGNGAASTSSVHLSPILEAGVGYRLALSGRVFLRPGLAIGAALKQYDAGVRNDPSPVPLATPWTYASFGIDTAVVFQ